MDGDQHCRACDGTGWVPYRSETNDGEFEEAYRFCPKGHAPRYCMEFSSGHLCPLPATVRCGPGYYCEEHSAVIREGRGIDGPCEANQGAAARRLRTFLTQAETPCVDENALSMLSRYETALERQTDRVQSVQNNELQRRQAIWGATAVVSPQVLDIKASGMCEKQESWAKCLWRATAPGSQNYQTKPNFWLFSCRDAVELAIVMGPADGAPDARRVRIVLASWEDPHTRVRRARSS